MQEIEVKFLEVNPEEIEKKLLALGAVKAFDTVFEEWIFQQPHWEEYRGRVRVRVENNRVLVAYKETKQRTSAGNTEIEFTVSDKDQVIAFLDKIEIPMLRHQQKRRIHFTLDNVAVEIDFWPKIPPLVEIEGKKIEAIEGVAKKIGFALEDACELDARHVIKDIYGVDIDAMKEYVF